MSEVLNRLVDPDDQYTDEEYKEQPEKEPEKEPEGDVLEVEDIETPADEGPEEPQVDSVTQRFNELGLDRQFPGGVEDMLNRMPYMNKWHTQLSQENADLKKQVDEIRQMRQQQVDNGQYDPEEFYQNPDSYLGGKYATKEEIEAVRSQVVGFQKSMFEDRYEKFRESHQDFNNMEPVMMQILTEDPGYNNLRDPLTALYHEARRRTSPSTQAAVKATQQKVSDSINKDKIRASTEGSGSKPKSRKITKDDLYNMSLPELEKLLGFKDDDSY